MELLTIRECSLGAFVEAIQEAILQGYRHSQEPSRYAWSDTQYNAILERSDEVVINPEDAKLAETEPSTEQQTSEEEAQPAKKLAGRPPRKLQ